MKNLYKTLYIERYKILRRTKQYPFKWYTKLGIHYTTFWMYFFLSFFIAFAKASAEHAAKEISKEIKYKKVIKRNWLGFESIEYHER